MRDLGMAVFAFIGREISHSTYRCEWSVSVFHTRLENVQCIGPSMVVEDPTARRRQYSYSGVIVAIMPARLDALARASLLPSSCHSSS